MYKIYIAKLFILKLIIVYMSTIKLIYLNKREKKITSNTSRIFIRI